MKSLPKMTNFFKKNIITDMRIDEYQLVIVGVNLFFY